MTFNSLPYALFLPAVVLTYWRLGGRARLWLLLVASYVFYGAWDPRFLVLIWISTIVDFQVGRRLADTDDERRRRALLLTSLAVNLGILGFFKYFGFFVESAGSLLETMGLDANLPTLRIILPVGISFYTFQTISYTFDIHRRRLEPTTDPLLFAVFVAFFPQLVAGPIERARNLLPQLASARDWPGREEIRGALHLILLGLVKKVVIADGLAPHVDRVFAGADAAGWVTATVAMYAFALQIYGDFSGYTDIARGSARLLGIDLMENFREPHFSRNIGEFWRRWHISLSTWLRDYLYFPLGGSRGTKRATYRNLFITMTLGGLWHGAAWTFVAWGALHGVKLAFERWRNLPAADDVPLRLRDTGRVLYTFTFVAACLVVFRSSGIGQAIDLLGGIAQLRPGPVDVDALAALIVLGAASVGIDVWTRWRPARLTFGRLAPALRGVSYGVAATALIVASGASSVPFIYFQF